MCKTCGCDNGSASQDSLPSKNATSTIVDLNVSILQSEEAVAERNRELFRKQRTLVVNLMSSPGAGKTALLERTALALKNAFKIAVIEGDLETENDADRIRKHGVQAEQITTGTACHLDALMISSKLPRFELEDIDILFIENVGNLICPACFDLGQDINVVLLSVPEGADKPEKYPVMFRAADLLLISKVDYLPVATEFSILRAKESMQKIGGRAQVMELAAPLGQGITEWSDWLLAAYSAKFLEKDTSSNTNMDA